VDPLPKPYAVQRGMINKLFSSLFHLGVNIPAGFEGIRDGLSDSVILARPEGEGLYLVYIRPAFREAVFGDIGLDDLAYDQVMAAEIKDMGDLAFQVDGTLFNEGYGLEAAVKNLEFTVLDLVRILAGNQAAVICFFYLSRGGDVEGKGPVLVNALKAPAVGLEGDSYGGGIAGRHARPGHGGKIRLPVS